MRSNWFNLLQSDNLKDASKDEGSPLTHCIVSIETFALISSNDKRTTLESEYNTDVRDDWWRESGGGGKVYRAKPLDTPRVYMWWYHFMSVVVTVVSPFFAGLPVNYSLHRIPNTLMLDLAGCCSLFIGNCREFFFSVIRPWSIIVKILTIHLLLSGDAFLLFPVFGVCWMVCFPPPKQTGENFQFQISTEIQLFFVKTYSLQQLSKLSFHTVS